MTKKITQTELVMEYFMTHPNRDIEHPEVVDWLTKEYQERTGGIFRDPDRAIRKLAQAGKLIKIRKGVYKYDPDLITNPELEDFTPAQREQIFKRDNYRCVICGKGQHDGIEIQVDPYKTERLRRQSNNRKWQTLCATHNFRKKNLKQTETGKKMFIRLYELSDSVEDHEMRDFCRNILDVFEEHNINDHVKWKR